MGIPHRGCVLQAGPPAAALASVRQRQRKLEANPSPEADRDHDALQDLADALEAIGYTNVINAGGIRDYAGERRVFGDEGFTLALR